MTIKDHGSWHSYHGWLNCQLSHGVLIMTHPIQLFLVDALGGSCRNRHGDLLKKKKKTLRNASPMTFRFIYSYVSTILYIYKYTCIYLYIYIVGFYSQLHNPIHVRYTDLLHLSLTTSVKKKHRCNRHGGMNTPSYWAPPARRW